MSSLIHKQIIKVNDKVVLQRVNHLPGVNAVGQDRAQLLSEFANNLNRDLKLKSNGSSAVLKTLENSKRPEHLHQQPGRPKMQHINPEDITRNLDSIEAQLQKLRSPRYASLNAKYNVDGFSKQLSSEVVKLKLLTESLNQDASASKVEFPYTWTKNTS
jgi:hypothetical protein